MKYVTIPDVPLPVSRLVLGAAGKRFVSGEDISELMETALDCGINAVDTAREYGDSEKTIGQWLQRSGRRNELVLISKCCHPALAFLSRVNGRAAEDDLKRSLEMLGTEKIDVYLLHRDNEVVPVGRIVDFLNRFYDEGWIGAFGGSNWSVSRIAAANAYAASHGLKGMSVSSPHYSIGWQKHDPWGNGCRTVTGDRKRAEREFYRETQMPLLAWSCLCNGVFSGKLKSTEWGKLKPLFGFNTKWAYDCQENRHCLAELERFASRREITVAQAALAWLLADDMNVLPVISASSPGRIRDNASAADLSCGPEIRNAIRVLKKRNS